MRFQGRHVVLLSTYPILPKVSQGSWCSHSFTLNETEHLIQSHTQWLSQNPDPAAMPYLCPESSHVLIYVQVLSSNFTKLFFGRIVSLDGRSHRNDQVYPHAWHSTLGPLINVYSSATHPSSLSPHPTSWHTHSWQMCEWEKIVLLHAWPGIWGSFHNRRWATASCSSHQ